jgi:hypothetical protein
MGDFEDKDKKKLINDNCRLWTSGESRYQLEESLLLLEKLANLNHIPVFALRHLALVRTNSTFKQIQRSEFDGNKLPVAIYSHGLYGWRQIHTNACEKLASQGYIVFSMDHIPDCTLSRPYLNSYKSTPFNFFPPKDCSLQEDRQFYMVGCNRRVNQVLRLIDYLELSSTKVDSIFYDLLDINKLVLWGHSYGACTMASVASRDSRPKAVVLLDSWMYPFPDINRIEGARIPILMLSSQLWPFGKYQVVSYLMSNYYEYKLF